jgi:FkbM family methyltransferase
MPGFPRIAATRARRWLRQRPRLQRFAVRVLRRFQGGYEERFRQALRVELRPGDCIWDVGANVGEYTKEFAEVVGEEGAVVAIEPSPACLEPLEVLHREAPRVVVLPLALADDDGMTDFSLVGGPTGVANRIGPGAEQTVEVRVARVDTLIDEGVPRPNLVKIDVEGFEGNVIDGMPRTLSDSRLRGLFIEVHFAQMEERGLRGEPERISRLLKAEGFSVRWPDPSHIVALRSSEPPA